MNTSSSAWVIGPRSLYFFCTPSLPPRGLSRAAVSGSLEGGPRRAAVERRATTDLAPGEAERRAVDVLEPARVAEREHGAIAARRIGLGWGEMISRHALGREPAECGVADGLAMKARPAQGAID